MEDADEPGAGASLGEEGVKGKGGGKGEGNVRKGEALPWKTLRARTRQLLW